MTPPRRIVVVGGGIAGLATAWEARRLAASAGTRIDVVVLEATGRAGGKLATIEADGFRIEAAADTFLVSKPWAVQLALDLGLGARLVGTHPRHRSAYVLSRGRLHTIPDGFRLMAPRSWRALAGASMLSPRGRLRAGLDLLVPRRAAAPGAEASDESLAAFVRRRLGGEVLEAMAGPIMAGIYMADPERLSLAATFPQFRAMERDHGSVIRGLRRGGEATARPRDPAWAAVPATPFVSLAGGVQELVDALCASLGEGVVHTEAAVERIERDEAGGYRVHAGGEVLAAERIVLAVPAATAARLLDDCAPRAAVGARTMRTASSAVAAFGLPRAAVGHPLDATGFVVDRREGLALVAASFASIKLPGRAPAEHVLLRAFAGGDGRERDLKVPDDALLDRLWAEMVPVLGLRGAPTLRRLVRWEAANPQYDVGHLDRVAAVEAACPPGLALAGSAWHGVGVPDCVRSGRRAAAACLEETTAGRSGQGPIKS